MGRPFLASGDNFKRSHVKGNTKTKLSDMTFAETLLRGKVFKTSRSILTVLIRVSNSDVVMPWVRYRPILNSLSNFSSSYGRTGTTIASGNTIDTYSRVFSVALRC